MRPATSTAPARPRSASTAPRWASAALKARLHLQREEERRKADAHRRRLQDRKDDRRHAVAQGVSRAVAVVKPEAQERLTADLWVRLTETDRIDADLADTALPIETLARRERPGSCSEIG
ncbi:hypothetical protein [Inquilinus sp. CA228]|uniref:hypothetical protein n=1 Tax=Inquilinus sp. CA228 TaxID=3455609 RepID=UPI003F8D7F16